MHLVIDQSLYQRILDAKLNAIPIPSELEHGPLFNDALHEVLCDVKHEHKGLLVLLEQVDQEFVVADLLNHQTVNPDSYTKKRNALNIVRQLVQSKLKESYNDLRCKRSYPHGVTVTKDWKLVALKNTEAVHALIDEKDESLLQVA